MFAGSRGSDPETAPTTTQSLSTAASATQAEATTTTVSPTVTLATAGDPIVVAANNLALGLTEGELLRVVSLMADDGDVRWVPWIVDIYQLFGVEAVAEEAALALEDMTGVPQLEEARDSYLQYARWMYATRSTLALSS